MATKKAKRYAAAIKRAEFLEAERDRGLAAQKADHDARAARHEALQEEMREIKRRHASIIAAAILSGRITAEELANAK